MAPLLNLARIAHVRQAERRSRLIVELVLASHNGLAFPVLRIGDARCNGYIQVSIFFFEIALPICVSISCSRTVFAAAAALPCMHVSDVLALVIPLCFGSHLAYS